MVSFIVVAGNAPAQRRAARRAVRCNRLLEADSIGDCRAE